MYNYKNSKSNIINILKSKTKIEEKEIIPKDQEFTYVNGISCWVSAIFVDIKNSSALFQTRDEKLARILRAFTSELITIMKDFNKLSQIGIRGDCVYAIYSTPKQDDVNCVFDIALKINSFMTMFNKLLQQEHYSTVGVGIGLGCDKELVIKAGRTGTGVNDKIWIGNAVVDASNLSSIANRYGYQKISMDTCFYSNIKKYYKGKEEWFSLISDSDYFNSDFYQCNIVDSEFDKWIEQGM